MSIMTSWTMLATFLSNICLLLQLQAGCWTNSNSLLWTWTLDCTGQDIEHRTVKLVSVSKYRAVFIKYWMRQSTCSFVTRGPFWSLRTQFLVYYIGFTKRQTLSLFLYNTLDLNYNLLYNATNAKDMDRNWIYVFQGALRSSFLICNSLLLTFGLFLLLLIFLPQPTKPNQQIPYKDTDTTVLTNSSLLDTFSEGRNRNEIQKCRFSRQEEEEKEEKIQTNETKRIISFSLGSE